MMAQKIVVAVVDSFVEMVIRRIEIVHHCCLYCCCCCWEVNYNQNKKAFSFANLIHQQSSYSTIDHLKLLGTKLLPYLKLQCLDYLDLVWFGLLVSKE